jgi:4-alpha-glucanotransferase
MNLSPDRKIAGVLVPLFALRVENDLGIGDLDALRKFIDWAAEIGFKLVQLLPINETGTDNSPYNAISAMAIEPTTLHLAANSPEDLTREDFDAVIADVDPSTALRTSLAAELKANVARDLGKALAPRDVLFVGDIPKTRNAKVMRRIARAAYLGEKLGDTSALENPGSLEEIRRAQKS